MAKDPIRGWLHTQSRKNLSQASIRRRRITLRRLERWCDDHDRSLLWLDTDTLNDWLDTLHVAPQSKAHYISDLASFYRWAQLAGFRKDDPTENIDRPHRPRYLPRPIADDDLRDAVTQAAQPLRIALVIAALAGLRVAEIARLDAADLNWTQHLIHVRQGKGRRDRIVPLHGALEGELRAYGAPKHGPVVHYDGRPYTPGSLSAKISRHMRGLGIDATAHSLRHWFATKAYSASGDIRAVQELLGHASLTTTQVYTALDPQAAREAVAGITQIRPLA